MKLYLTVWMNTIVAKLLNKIMNKIVKVWINKKKLLANHEG